MTWLQQLRRLLTPSSRRAPRGAAHRPPRVALALERLEDRTLLSGAPNLAFV